MVEVRIDAPGAGAWIMERAQGRFSEGWDHVFSTHDETGRILGGFALTDFLGGSMTMHMAGDDKRWFTRELARIAFHYPLIQLGCNKLLAPLRSTNHAALALCLRFGWRFEAIIRDGFRDAHLIVLSMTRETCPWLTYTPRQWSERAF